MITRNEAEQTLIHHVKSDNKIMKELYRELPGRNNVASKKLPNGDVVQYLGNPWGLIEATYAYKGTDDWHTFDFKSLKGVFPKSGLACMWTQLTAQFDSSHNNQEVLLGYAKYFSLLDLDFEYKPHHPQIINLLGEAPTFYLPTVSTYSIDDIEKTGVYVHIHDRYSRHGKTQLQQFITGKEKNLFFAMKLPVANFEFDQSYDPEELLSFGYTLAKCHDEFYITEPQYLTIKLEKSTINGVESDRLEVPVDELFEAHDWLEESSKCDKLK